jgi:hypothetical protein
VAGVVLSNENTDCGNSRRHNHTGDALTRLLIQIPKGEVDKKVANGKADRIRRKKRKKK